MHMQVKSKTNKLIFLFVLLISIFSLLPFVVLTAYNHPSVDDFIYSFAFIKDGFFIPQYNWYVDWSGRYTATAFLSLSPISFYSFTGYKFGSLALLTFLGVAFYYLVNQLFYKESFLNRISVSLLIFIIYLYQMPKIATGLYWGAGATTYQLGNVFTLLMLGSLILFFKTKKNKHKMLVIGFLFLLIGSNETVMLLTDMLLFFLAIFYYTRKQKLNIKYIKSDSFLILLLVFAFVFSLIVFLAPGNDVRLRHLPNKHKLIAFYNSYLSAKQYLIMWLPSFGVFSLLTLSLITKLDFNKEKWFSIHPIFAFIIVLLITYAGFFPAHWSMGVPPPARTINTIYFFFILTWMYFILSLFSYFKTNTFPQPFKYTLLVIGVIFFIKPNNIQTAYQDWLSGDAKKYNQQLENRYKLITEKKAELTEKDTLVVSALDKKPKTLFFNDIGEKPDDWRNKSYAKYFEIPNIIIEKKE